jgi:hypothetical protein
VQTPNPTQHLHLERRILSKGKAAFKATDNPPITKGVIVSLNKIRYEIVGTMPQCSNNNILEINASIRRHAEYSRWYDLCEFFSDKIKYIGHIYTQGNISSLSLWAPAIFPFWIDFC